MNLKLLAFCLVAVSLAFTSCKRCVKCTIACTQLIATDPQTNSQSAEDYCGSATEISSWKINQRSYYEGMGYTVKFTDTSEEDEYCGGRIWRDAYRTSMEYDGYDCD